MTAVEARLSKPLRTGNQWATIGLLIVLIALALNPASRLTWAVNLVGVAVSTWGTIQVLNTLVQLRGRRSLSEASVGVFLVGAAAAMTITIAQGPLDRGNNWLVGIAAIGFVLLGVSLEITALVDHRGERRRIVNPLPPQPPSPDAISEPQLPGTLLLPLEVNFLRLALAISFVAYLVVLFDAIMR